MNNKIESVWYINNEDMVWIRYHVDENAVVWYNYKDICEKLNLDGRKALGMYKDLSENDRYVFFDLNNDQNKNNYNETPFITEEGLYEIEKQVAEKFGVIYRNIYVIKQKAQSSENYIIKTEKDMFKDFICNAIDVDALEEFTVDASKMEYYLDYEEGCNQPIMKKKVGYIDAEARKILYKKHKEAKENSTRPIWLKDVIK